MVRTVAAAAIAALGLATPAAADETWSTTFGTLVYLEDLTPHGPPLAVLSYPAGEGYTAGFVAVDNLAQNIDDRGLSAGYWWTHGGSGERCDAPFIDPLTGQTTHHYGRVSLRFLAKDWAESDFAGLYSSCLAEPSLAWNGRHN